MWTDRGVRAFVTVYIGNGDREIGLEVMTQEEIILEKIFMQKIFLCKKVMLKQLWKREWIHVRTIKRDENM